MTDAKVKVYNLDMNAEEAPAFVVAAEDYDSIAAQLAASERERDALRELLQDARNHPGDPYVAERIDAALERT